MHMAVKYQTKCRLCKKYKIIKPGLAYCTECWERSINKDEEDKEEYF